MTGETRSSGDPPPFWLVGFPPLFYIRRRRWTHAVLGGLIYVWGVSLLWSALSIATSERNFAGAAPLAGIGLLCWLLLYHKVRSDQSTTAVPTVPVTAAPSPRGPLVEALLLFLALVVTPIVPALMPKPGEEDRVRASLAVEARWHAGWLADHALEFQRVTGRAPTDALQIVARFVQPETLPAGHHWSLHDESHDPWRRPWVLRVDTGEAWVCSHGPSDAAQCPAGRLTALPGASAGTVGYSTKFGPWGDVEPRPFLQALFGTLAIAAWFLPVGTYIVYRLIRRVRGRSTHIGTHRAMLTVVAAVVPFWAVLILAVHNDMHSRSLSSRAAGHIAMFNGAIARYRADTGDLPPTLSSLAERAPSTVDRGTRVIDKGAFPYGRCRGTGNAKFEEINPFYTYRRWADGRYFITCPQPVHQRPTVMARGLAR